jgi:protein CpxP
MSKSKFFKLIILGLLISNAIVVFMLINGRDKKNGHKNLIIKKLHFDKEQIKNYEVYIQKHRKDINDNETVMNTLRSNLYKELNNSNNITKIDSLIAIIGKQQTIAEQINYNHFLELKKLCKPNQTKGFEKLTTEIANLFSPKERK